MKTSKEIPQIYFELRDRFNVKWEDGLAITVGETVFSKFNLLPDVIVHEAVHIEQQKKIGSTEWWNRYISNSQFRLEQEIEAYQIQSQWIKNNIKDRNLRFVRLHKICKHLSGNMYGNIVSYAECYRMIFGKPLRLK